ncbi:ATP synthase F1 subunit delta [Telmatobacter bradus]|jgi:F-type H+-transporting ATPase subunit delta|uniref:ATP synthase F1 subunit delta n=1 Tax=Telmatobacter bradus TaxID=474953 RepID=UPI003B428574
MAAFVSRYAAAFADVVRSAKLDTTAIDAQLDDFLATWKGSSELQTFFVNPSIAALEKVAVLDKLNQKLGLIKELRNLIAVLITHNRISGVEEVAAAYRKLQQEQSGIRQAEIVTARLLNEVERAKLTAEVAKLAGSKVDASFREDASVLGGAVVRIGSTVYDGSLRGRLERLKDALVGS